MPDALKLLDLNCITYISYAYFGLQQYGGLVVCL